jgi:hypothetical protein
VNACSHLGLHIAVDNANYLIQKLESQKTFLEQRDELLAAVADNASDSVIVMKSREDPIRKTVSEIMETRDRERGLNRPLTPELISITIEILRYSIFNGMDSTMFVSFDVSDSALFRNEQPFGNAVWNAFPSAIDDSIEAGKCIALERYTAAVFHLMRVLEAGLKALAKALGAPRTGASAWETSRNARWTSIQTQPINRP